MRTSSRVRFVAVALALAIPVAGCGSSDSEGVAVTTTIDAALTTTTPEPAAENRVAMVNFTFQPGAITVPAGTTVTWVNNDETDHTATGDDEGGTPFDTGAVEAGADGTVTFDEPGTFDYHCEYHSYMTGTVTVTG